MSSDNLIKGDETIKEILDPVSIKARLEEHRAAMFKTLDGQQNNNKKKTKALTTQAASLKDYEKQIVFCPTCSGYGRGSRMMPYKLEILLNAPAIYQEVVGGLGFPDDTIFLHCRICNLRLIPQVDPIEKLDAYQDEEYVIESLTDTQRLSNRKPQMAAQKGRYNRVLKQKDEIYQSRRSQSLSTLSKKYTASEQQQEQQEEQ